MKCFAASAACVTVVLSSVLGGVAGAQEMPPTDAMAWVLGSKLGLAAVVHESGKDPDAVAEMLKTANLLAEALGTSVPPLPERGQKSDAEFGADVMHFIIQEVEPISKRLHDQHGEAHALYFEMSIKASSLAIIYGPGDENGLAVADMIQDRAQRTALPEKLWQPIVESIRAKQTYDEVIDQLFAFHETVREHLMAGG